MNKVEVDVDPSGESITINKKKIAIPEKYRKYVTILSYILMGLAGYVLGQI